MEIRDKILRLQLITVELGTEDDAYLIFETMNTRGKDLTVSDLVKNHLTRLIQPTHKGVDTTKDKWNAILEMFLKTETPISVNRFLHHSWLSKKPYTTEKKLFKEIKKSIKKASADQFLDELVIDAQLYRQLLVPDTHKWANPERDLANAIRALNVFRVVQPVPIMLSLLREYRDKGITIKQAKQCFQAMEDFHAQFTGVTSQRTGGGTALMYASSARQLLEARSKDEKGKVMQEFVAKLRDRVPSYEEFEAAFVELGFTDDNTRQRALVRYLLRRIDHYIRPGTPPDYEQLTIEHLAPQSPNGKGAVSGDVIGMMGNLLLVTEKLNDKLANRPFADKLKILKESDVPMDEPLRDASIWDDEAIESRTKRLARLCYDSVFSF